MGRIATSKDVGIATVVTFLVMRSAAMLKTMEMKRQSAKVMSMSHCILGEIF